MSKETQTQKAPRGSPLSPCSVSQPDFKRNMNNAHDIAIILYKYTHRAQGQRVSTARRNNKKWVYFSLLQTNYCFT